MLPLMHPLTAVACANVNTGLAFVSSLSKILEQLSELNLKTLQSIDETVASNSSPIDSFTRLSTEAASYGTGLMSIFIEANWNPLEARPVCSTEEREPTKLLLTNNTNLVAGPVAILDSNGDVVERRTH